MLFYKLIFIFIIIVSPSLNAKQQSWCFKTNLNGLDKKQTYKIWFKNFFIKKTGIQLVEKDCNFKNNIYLETNKSENGGILLTLIKNQLIPERKYIKNKQDIFKISEEIILYLFEEKIKLSNKNLSRALFNSNRLIRSIKRYQIFLGQQWVHNLNSGSFRPILGAGFELETWRFSFTGKGMFTLPPYNNENKKNGLHLDLSFGIEGKAQYNFFVNKNWTPFFGTGLGLKINKYKYNEKNIDLDFIKFLLNPFFSAGIDLFKSYENKISLEFSYHLPLQKIKHVDSENLSKYTPSIAFILSLSL